METPEKVTAGCLGLDFSRVQSPGDYEQWLETGLAAMAEREARLVLLPGGTGLALYLSCHPDMQNLDFPAAVRELAAAAGQARPEFHRIHRQMARRFNIYLAAGTTWYEEAGGIQQAAPFYGPDGDLVGEQPQTHLSREEREWGWRRGTTLAVWPTGAGRVGLVTGSDAWYPEVSRILALQGADLLLAPAMVPSPATHHLALAGMWQEVQQNQVFALENWPGGQLGQRRWTGWSAIHAPCEMTPGETGFLAPQLPSEAEAPPGFGNPPREPLTAVLDFKARKRVIDHYPIARHLNPTLYRRYFPHTYHQGKEGNG